MKLLRLPTKQQSNNPLQTDALRRETGAAGIVARVLQHDMARRVAVICTVDDQGRHTPQTYAVTKLCSREWSPQLGEVNAVIAQGASMGEAFREHGLSVYQNRRLLLWRVKLPLTAWLARLFDVKTGTLAEIEVYDLFADGHRYGLVLEIKRPGRKVRNQRRCFGSYEFLRALGISREMFTSWLEGKEPTFTQRLLLWLGRLVGVGQGLTFAAAELIKSRRR